MTDHSIAADENQLAAILDAWDLPEPRVVRAVGAGTNNLSRFVEAPSGRYFLRIYQNRGAGERARYEHRLLHAVATMRLPFRVPQPIVARSGETLVGTGLPGEGQLAALFTIIPGRAPVRGNPAEAALVGAALARLHRALAATDLPTPANQASYGDFERIHPLVPDPLAAMRALPVPVEVRKQVEDFYHDLVAVVPVFYATLPRQVIHGDFGRGNSLIDRDRVSGILDFEFAGPDLRAIDVAAGLWSFSVSAWGSGEEWPIIDAFLQGYRSMGALTQNEAEALPSLLRLREATSLIHWVGRWRQGLTGEEAIRGRVNDLLFLDRWTSAVNLRA